MTTDCKHPDKPDVPFDEEKARAMTVAERRKEFPRMHYRCPHCGNDVILYASYMHYLMGDY